MMVTVPVERLVFVDESGFYTRMTPLYACAPRGERAYGHVPRNHTRNTTLVAALSRAGWPRSFAVAWIAVSCHRRNRTKPCHPSLPAFVQHHGSPAISMTAIRPRAATVDVASQTSPSRTSPASPV
jgi:hypothetical protein